MKKFLVALLVTASAVPASAALLVGNATLTSGNDLTVIQDGATTYQFLDLTRTLGMSQNFALLTYGSQGFSVATSVSLTALYDAFGFTYVAPNGFAQITTINSAEAANFTSYLGATLSTGSLGSYIDATYGQSYNCIGFGVCSNDAFNNRLDLSSGNSSLGVYLVRNSVAAVPEPAMLGLFGLGAIGLGLSRRRRNV